MDWQRETSNYTLLLSAPYPPPRLTTFRMVSLNVYNLKG